MICKKGREGKEKENTHGEKILFCPSFFIELAKPRVVLAGTCEIGIAITLEPEKCAEA